MHRAEQRERDEGGQAGERRLGRRSRGSGRAARRAGTPLSGGLSAQRAAPSRPSARAPAAASAATRRRAVAASEPAS